MDDAIHSRRRIMIEALTDLIVPPDEEYGSSTLGSDGIAEAAELLEAIVRRRQGKHP